jgi:hypothetical protein
MVNHVVKDELEEDLLQEVMATTLEEDVNHSRSDGNHSGRRCHV